MIVEKTSRFNYLRGVLIIILSCIIFFHPNNALKAQTRRALLVGIDMYMPERDFKPTTCRNEPLENLKGCINDAAAMQGILESRFHFKKENIQTLLNERATRESIISSFKKYLIREASPGDICLFYFSGHGSWVTNLKSTESDKRDETLVPFDWYKGKRDIRDKELKRLFNEVLDKQAYLTVIVDACHSGSISRGLPVRRQYKAAPPESCVISEEPDKSKTPAERGALILSAARSFQEAAEIFDEDTETYHGLFTWALLKVLRSNSVNESVETIIQRVDALMHSEGREQRVTLHHPATEAPPELRKKPLFGKKPGERFGIAAAVDEVEGNEIILRAGFAAGIRKECQLKKISYDKEKPEVLVRVTKVNGLNRCQAKVISGDPEDIEPGDLFEVHKWAAPQETRLKVWMPTAPYSDVQLMSMAGEVRKLKGVDWLDRTGNPTEKSPTHTLFWNKFGWCLQTNKKKTLKLGKQLNSAEILKKILSSQWERDGKPCLFFQLPCGVRLNKAIRAEITDYKDSIKVVSAKKDAHYMLVGRMSGREIQYEWIIPDTINEKKEGFALPVRTGWITAENSEAGLQKTASQLGDHLLRLVKIRAWLQLTAPPDKGEFPYRLFLKNANTGELKTKGPLLLGDIYGLVMRADKETLDAAKGKEKRYVYVFSIDSHGKGTLLFPKITQMDSGNYFPANEEWPTEIKLGIDELFRIGGPSGMDTYIFLTTNEAISNPDVLNFKGVRRGAAKGLLSTPLERLLYGIGAPVRRSSTTTPVNWSIQRLSILSIDR